MTLIYSIFAGIILSLVGWIVIQNHRNNNLEEDNQHQADAIVAYEQIIKVVPFEALGGEWKDRANEEINTTLSNTDHVVDNTYKL